MRVLILRDQDAPIIADALQGAENELRGAIAATRDLDQEKRVELVDVLRVIARTRRKIQPPTRKARP